MAHSALGVVFRPDQNLAEMLSPFLYYEPDDETVSADVGHAYYYLVLEDGYLSVYYGADRSFYGYTDIRFDTLDQQTQKEILKGLSFATEEELYEFLENHSS